MMDKELLEQLKKVAFAHQLQFYAIWGVTGGRGWIAYKQEDKNDHIVQISTGGSFDEYASIKEAVSAIFDIKGCCLVNEDNAGKRSFGYQKNLVFIDREKAQAAEKESHELLKAMTQPPIGTQINGDIHQSGGSFNTGATEKIDNSSQNNTHDDEKWFRKEVVKMLLSFIGGVGATILAQWLMRLLGWIK